MTSSEEIVSVLLKTLSLNDSNAEIEDTWEFAENSGIDHVTLVGVLKSLEADKMTKAEMIQTKLWELTSEGYQVLEEGSPEYQIMKLIGISEGKTKAELSNQLPPNIINLGLGPCMKNKWLVKGENEKLIRQNNSEVFDFTKEKLEKIQSLNFDAISESDLKDLKRRKLINQAVRKSYKVTKGSEYSLERKKKTADLTKEMLDSGEWKNATFKSYNFNTLGIPVNGGFLHPLLKVRTEFRKILIQMGFEEMPTNRWVESSFWNFDSLFQPQSHPARDAHDTFFVEKPKYAKSVPENYLEKVKDMHENGGSGSIGYRYNWKREEAMKNLLRTHTTAISSQMLYKLANQEGGFKPKRYFSIDRVFRNESMDATHLCEFHQVEGLIADRNLSLGDLIGTIKFFFEQIGITKVRFKPAYNPYTEPSMEIFGFHPDLNRWTEIGNSGMFRPEMLRPMGFSDDIRVIAWGLSLERPTMIKYRISNIRDLFGHKANLNRTKTAPICRFDI
mmetsp:Transcript_12986/g.18197  ORF Transcript_12986/g.18197 Transcript_12986/m.18197 type:complete len:503 (+) Transcript_12986:68-1576(+)